MTRGGNPPPDTFLPELLAPLEALAVTGHVRVALSGGLDSVVLLHLAHRVFEHHPAGFSAIHVNHQLQPDAVAFEALCQRTCEQLAVPLEVVPVQVDAGGGSIETAARNARYQVFSERLDAGDVLLMAHHADDQVETLLFRFLRGTGVHGLAGMPMKRPLDQGMLVRPWLQMPRSWLRQLAQRAGWSWVEDPTNTDEGFDRNFLRQRVLPDLRQRWPSLERRLLATARACGESAELATMLAETHFHQLQAGPGRLHLPGFRALPMAARRNLLQWWLGEDLDRSLGDHEIRDLTEARDHARPEILAGEFALRRFQDHIYRVSRSPAPLAAEQSLAAGRTLQDGVFRLYLHPAEGSGSMPELHLRHRRGGERFRPRPDGPTRSLKKWLQEQQVPPWERDQLPLVFRGNDELVAVADLWCEPGLAGPHPGNGGWLEIRRE
ncbi:tRNA lysidine(34) synthetase TilS [Marinobacter sp. LN3S78]|uniref:tRNA lysidine(34) synthetase TilS n=1 Tax=Marinobacter sp. LN3S78 TaxID=3382300 RepID=UPI00387B9C29